VDAGEPFSERERKKAAPDGSDFSRTVEAFWHAPLDRGEVVFRASGLTVVCNPALPDDRRVMVLDLRGAATIVMFSPAMASMVLSRPIRDESDLRAALAEARVALHSPDALFYISRAGRAALRDEADHPNVRRVTARDRGAFAEFAAAAPAQDLDDAYVELEHWAVFGAFCQEELVCAASMYPWGDSGFADLGVLTLPAFRGQGFARSVVRAICRYALGLGREPQYRCQLDNAASRALAASSGFTWFANWEVVSPDSPT